VEDDIIIDEHNENKNAINLIEDDGPKEIFETKILTSNLINENLTNEELTDKNIMVDDEGNLIDEKDIEEV